MLTFYSVLWGNKYPAVYAQRLHAAVDKHLTVAHRSYCISDKDVPGVQTIKPIVDWPDWWQKLQLFGIATGPSIYIDLDSLVVGNLDYLAELASNNLFCAPSNWGQSGHGGVQSSVMAWNGEYREPFEAFDSETDIPRLWGDQEFISELVGNGYTRIPRVYSYKYHCQQAGKSPADAAIVTFHGKPDYHECGESWISQYMSTTV